MTDRYLETKQNILYAAADCFALYGYDICTMDTIAARINLSAGSIYNYYDGKEPLLQEIFEYFLAHFAQYRTPTEAILAAAETKPMREVFPLFFYSFGIPEENAPMLHMAKVIVNMKFDNPEAGRIFAACFWDGPMEYTLTTLTQLQNRGKLSCVDIEALAYLTCALAYKNLLDTMDNKKHSKKHERHFQEGVAVLAKLVEQRGG